MTIERRPYATPVEYEIQDFDKKPVLILRRKTEKARTLHCPFCGLRHLHGIGDGHRHPHCDSHDGGLVREYLTHDDGTKLYQEQGYIVRTNK